jgi:hypothetical protein
MKRHTGTPNPERRARLKCPTCGNVKLFLEVMAEELHVVDGSMNYVRLAAAEVDHYECLDCDTEIKAPR